MTFPMIVADYFAKACGLPNLFVGTYGDTTIEYINVIRSGDAFGWRSRTTVLVKSNKWLWACDIRLESLGDKAQRPQDYRCFMSPIVDLSDIKDGVRDITLKHEHFPNPNTRDGSDLQVDLFTESEFISRHVSNPDLSESPSTDLNEARIALQNMIQKRAKEKQYVLALAMESHNLLLNDEYKFDYLQFYKTVRSFGLSGVFSGENLPDDLDFLLILPYVLRHSLDTVAFAKTSRWFRSVRSFHNKHQDDIQIEFDEPDVNWYYLIFDADRREKIKLDTQVKQRIEVYYFQSGIRKLVEFYRPNQGEPMSKLWNVLESMLKQFEVEE